LSRLVSRAESWEQIYTSFQQVNFAAFDYDTIKHSLLDYLKLYFPESFNDFIESEELVAIVEVFSNIATLIAYRLDMDAHENFISTAQRQDSILRLAKLVSYAADRPIPARGLVKITSVVTTETVIDSVGNNLAGRTIGWNDTSNVNWKDQFIVVMDTVLSQSFGTVNPVDRFQIQDVLFDLYNINSIPLQAGIFSYTATTNGQQLPMELVPVSYDPTIGVFERRPSNNSNFTFLYGQDGLGDSSDSSGFMCFTKQGTLTKYRQVFDGITPNQSYEVPLDNVNNIDVWVNNIDPITGNILNNTSILQHNTAIISGEWVEVDNSGSYNVIFNNVESRSKYEVETRANNRIGLMFGDGDFSDIPTGTFDIWVRSSVNQDIMISQSAVINKQASFNYIDTFGLTQTFTFTFSLINSLQNGSSSESLEHIRTTAPSTYYTQARMVNGKDYNTFMNQDSSILKLRSVNRTFAGDSKYIAWHDPSNSYDNVKMFSNDGTLYYNIETSTISTPVVDINTLILTYIEPLLSSSDTFLYTTSYGVPVDKFKRKFTTAELAMLSSSLNPPPSPTNVGLYYNITTYSWHVVPASSNPVDVLSDWSEKNYILSPLITIRQTQNTSTIQNGATYNIVRYANRLIFHSPTTQFSCNNTADAVIDYSTLKSDFDVISILQANINHNRDGILSNTWNFNVLGQSLHTTGPYVGLPDATRISILPADINNDGVPDYLDINDASQPLGLANIIKPKIIIDYVGKVVPADGYVIKLPTHYIAGIGDVSVYCSNLPTTLSGVAIPGVHWKEIIHTASYQVVNIGGNNTPSSSTGLANGSNVYSTRVYVNNVLFIISVIGSEAQTIGDLITQLSVLLVSVAQVALVNGNIRITSNSILASSSIIIVDIDLFSSLSGSQHPLISTPHMVVTSNEISILPAGGLAGLNNSTFIITMHDFVYFYRVDKLSDWLITPTTIDALNAYIYELSAGSGTWTRRIGRTDLNFAWFHHTPNYHLIDPAASNIIDTFIIQKGYFLEFKGWLEGSSNNKPTTPTPLDLRLAYGSLLANGMISDTVILHPGIIKVLFGKKADPMLQATFKVIRSIASTLTDNQIKTSIVTTIRNFFDVTMWEFGETFYFSELSAAIHSELANDISSIVIVPVYISNHFGSLYQIIAKEDEIFYPDISVIDIELITSYDDISLRAQPDVIQYVTNITNVTNVMNYTNSPGDGTGTDPGGDGTGTGGTGTGTGGTDCATPYCDLSYCTADYIESLTPCSPDGTGGNGGGGNGDDGTGIGDGAGGDSPDCATTYCDTTYCVPTYIGSLTACGTDTGGTGGTDTGGTGGTDTGGDGGTGIGDGDGGDSPDCATTYCDTTYCVPTYIGSLTACTPT
jgi:hypothetical protein